MKSAFTNVYFWACSLALLAAAEASTAACDQTLSPGANVASAVSSAAAGSTICLNAGSYGSASFSNINKTSDVTVKSASARGASINITIASSSHLKFDSLTIGSLDYQGASKNNTISNSTFTGQALFNMANNSDSNTLVDGNTFDGIDARSYEGRLHVFRNGGGGGATGVKITNNHFGGGGCSDGVRADTSGVVIGPGNRFDGVIQGNCAAHVDAIQGYGNSNTTITGNYFINNTVDVGFYDGGSNETITNNVFTTPHDRQQNLQLGGIQGMVISHNTLRDTVLAYGTKSGQRTNTGWTITNNLLVNSSIIKAGDQPGCTSDCVVSFNLTDSKSSVAPTGTDQISGTPIFAGGTAPSSWDGFALQPTSPGYGNASDGGNRGANYFGKAVALPNPPTNVAVR